MSKIRIYKVKYPITKNNLISADPILAEVGAEISKAQYDVLVNAEGNLEARIEVIDLELTAAQIAARAAENPELDVVEDEKPSKKVAPKEAKNSK